MLNQAKLDWYKRRGLALPTRQGHGTIDEITDKLKQPTKVFNWHLEGNKLVAQTELGTHVQVIPPNYICRGVDENGLPILDKIDIQ